MSSAASQTFPNLSQEPSSQLRHPLTQLHNQAPIASTRDGRSQFNDWMNNAQKISCGLEANHSSAQYYTPPKTSSNAPATIPMLAPSYGGLYRANAHHNGSRLQSFPQSPPREISPKHVDLRQEAGTDFSGSNEADQIATYLQIPSSINSSKGSLSEFAAQITCLFWFESSLTLHQVSSRNPPAPPKPLVPEAKPSLGFQKWVTTILSTTQVSTNVILLALMFIYRLKKLNPSVKGKPGSEYRLLTVALMLGNKFLDDNTYTNKTWAEVSGITVSEIHIMEVEFLSNMRYTLYASHHEWWAWHDQLSRFYDYFERASNLSKENLSQASAVSPIASQLSYSSPPTEYMSSPIRSYNLMNASTRLVSSSATPSYPSPITPSPISRLPEVTPGSGSRKRSHDGMLQEPQPKRVSRAQDNSITSDMAHNHRLPYPTQSRPNQQGIHLPSTYSTYLPPPTNRAMASVYSQHPKAAGDLLKPQPNTLPSLGIKIPPMEFHPNRALPSAHNSKASSPIAMAMTPTTDLLSPLNYNINRSSPYRPVRSVNTLLVPPPSASLQNPSQSVGSSDMHYQPLGKLSERRSGVVPYMPQAYPPQSWTPHDPFQSRQGYA